MTYSLTFIWEKNCKFIIKMMVYNWCTQINLILAGTINISKNKNDSIKIKALNRYKTLSKKPKFKKQNNNSKIFDNIYKIENCCTTF